MTYWLRWMLFGWGAIRRRDVALVSTLASIAFDKAQMSLVADPRVSTNRHELAAKGTFGHFRLPSTANLQRALQDYRSNRVLSLVQPIRNRIASVAGALSSGVRVILPGFDAGKIWHDIRAFLERMDIETLRIFGDVARRGSFAVVARDRNTDPSSVSRTIASLEDELHVRLFQRSTRRMTLTEAGAKYLARIKPLIEEIDHARDEALAISVRPIGTLRLTASIAFGYKCIAPISRKCVRHFPNCGSNFF